MNEELRTLAIKAGAPVEVIDTMWFNIFCQSFANELISATELEMQGLIYRIVELESQT